MTGPKSDETIWLACVQCGMMLQAPLRFVSAAVQGAAIAGAAEPDIRHTRLLHSLAYVRQCVHDEGGHDSLAPDYTCDGRIEPVVHSTFAAACKEAALG